MIKKIAWALVVLFFGFLAFQYFYGGRPDPAGSISDFQILAHRGLHVNWIKGAYDPITGCEALHIEKPTHDVIENTLASIGAAFDLGATIVEVDIRRTKDNRLVVFHDDRLDGRTNGTGAVRDWTLDSLKALDIGYGYTYDGGVHHPFRGQGVGQMVTLDEVLARFPDKHFLIDDKDGSETTTALLADLIETLPPEQQARMTYWGRDRTLALIQRRVPAVKKLLMNRGEGKRWLKSYLLGLGLRGFPTESRGLVIALRPEHTKYIWGWPHRFIHKVHEAGAQFYLFIDEKEDAKKYDDLPMDGVITDAIERVGPIFHHRVQ